MKNLVRELRVKQFDERKFRFFCARKEMKLRVFVILYRKIVYFNHEKNECKSSKNADLDDKKNLLGNDRKIE